MAAAGNWKADIGWDIIDLWVEEAGGLYHPQREKEVGGITYADIIYKCIELCGSAPSKATLSNHFNPSVREKARIWKQERRTTLIGVLEATVYRFKELRGSKHIESPPKNYETVRETLRIRLKDFRRHTGKGETMKQIDNYIEYWEKEYNLVIKDEEASVDCYLCGDPISISINNDSRSTWNLDHIVPTSKGGSGEKENSGITHRNCNHVKSDLSVEELLVLLPKITSNLKEKYGKKRD